MAKSTSLDTFWGGILLNSCAPLHLSLNWCTHHCLYCFANLNKPDRRAYVQQAERLIENAGDRVTLAAYLLRERYPVVISNHVDPLAISNFEISLELIELLQSKGIPLVLQTKGAHKDEWLGRLLNLINKPTQFYVSLALLDDELARKLEPGAPPPSQRLRQIKQIIDAGHTVTVGVNPLVPEWLPQPEMLIEALQEMGVWGIWIQGLHISHRQFNAMPERDRAKFSETVMQQSRHRSGHPDVIAHLERARAYADRMGLPVYDAQQRQPSRYFEPFEQLYPKRYPLMQEFVNYCHQYLKAGDFIYWPEFRDFFAPKLPPGEWPLKTHFFSVTVWQRLTPYNIPQRMTYEQFLWYCWQHHETMISPANVDCFAYAAHAIPDEPGRFNAMRDNQGNYVLMFCPNGTDGWAFQDVDRFYHRAA